MPTNGYGAFAQLNHLNNNNNKMTSLEPISSENPSSVAKQTQRHSRDHVQCEKSSTDGRAKKLRRIGNVKKVFR